MADPDFDYVLWGVERDQGRLSLAEAIVGEHVTRARAPCCIGIRPALLTSISVWKRGWYTRDLWEVPLVEGP